MGMMIETSLERIAQVVQQESLMTFVNHRLEVLRRRVDERVQALALADCPAYLDYLLRFREERQLLVELLTVNETFFFRNQRQFDFLKENLLEIETRRGEELFRSQSQHPGLQKHRLTILSAGCSTGEEPYSVAMTLLETLRYPRAWDLTILAGDLCESCLKTATDGFYPENRLKHLPVSLRDKYMEEVAGGWRVREELKRLVDFRPFNLKEFIADPDYTEKEFNIDRFDIIFCRNVMIYFDFSSQQRLVDALFAALVPGGHLLTGDAEPLHLYRHAFSSVAHSECLVYRKDAASFMQSTTMEHNHVGFRR